MIKTNEKQVMSYVTENYRLIQFIVNKLCERRQSMNYYDDCCQEIYILLIERICKHPEYIEYDGSGNIVKVRNMSTIITNGCIDFLRKFKRLNDPVVPLPGLSDEGVAEDASSDFADSFDWDDLDSKLENDAKIESIRNFLSPLEFDILMMQASGYSLKEISKAFDIDHDKMRMKIYEIRQKVRKKSSLL